jgi:geranylgeranyl pyrophosphate synthase
MKSIISNDRGEYYDFSSRVSLLVDDYIEKYLESNKLLEKRDFYEPMLSKKIGAQKLRANIVCASYLFFSNKKKIDIPEKLIKYCVIIEFVSWASYMVNWIYDGKSKVEDSNVKKRVAVAANAFLQDAVILARTESPLLLEIVLDANDEILKSFWPELDTLKITNEELVNNYEKYYTFYKNSYGYPGVGALFSASIHLGYLCSKSNNESLLKKVRDIFREFGMNHETLNALADFVITEGPISHEKISSDQFSDIRNNTLTPPIWHIINAKPEYKKLILEGIGERPSVEYQKRIMLALFESGTYDKIASQLKKTGRDLKKAFPKSTEYNIGRVFLKQIISVFESNEIYHFLNDNYEELA